MQITKDEYAAKDRKIKYLEEALRVKSAKLDLLCAAVFLGLPIISGFIVWRYDIISPSDITEDGGISCVRVFDKPYCD